MGRVEAWRMAGGEAQSAADSLSPPFLGPANLSTAVHPPPSTTTKQTQRVIEEQRQSRRPQREPRPLELSRTSFVTSLLMVTTQTYSCGSLLSRLPSSGDVTLLATCGFASDVGWLAAAAAAEAEVEACACCC